MKTSLSLSVLLSGVLLTGCSDIRSAYEDQKKVIKNQKTVIDDLTDTNTHINKKLSDAQFKLKSSELNQQYQGEVNNLNSQYEQKLNKMIESLSELNSSLPLADVIKPTVNPDGSIGIPLPSSILFRSGSSSLSAQGGKVISHIVTLLEKYPNRNIRIEGHTDKDPIKKSKYSSNWALGAARAVSVVEAITKKTSISPAMFHASSHSKYRPVSKTNKQANRRVQIVILNN
jgi:chemotaxis protein MotB